MSLLLTQNSIELNTYSLDPIKKYEQKQKLKV